MSQAVSALTVAPPGPLDEESDRERDTADAGPALIEDELLVEEISIDGMCGVY
jgi:mycofactocin precursor